MKAVLLLLSAAVLTLDAAYLRSERQKREDTTDPCTKKCKSSPMEISFVVDGSASIWPDNFTLGLNFIEDFVDIFEISPTAVRVSLVTYGDVVYVQDDFGFADYDNKEDLKKAISKVPYHSGQKTNTSGGIWHMLRQQMPAAREGVRHVAVVLTDGNSQERDLTKQAAADAKEAGLEVFAIGVGHEVSLQELHNIASDNRHVFVVSAYKMLEDIKERLAYEACAAPPNPICKMEPVDLAFVIDSSASIGEGNFTVGMKFVQDIVDNFQINPSVVRISSVTFGDRVYMQDAFGFDAYSDKKEVLDRLEGIIWRHGTSTETGKGIQYMRDVQMASARPSAAHVCIVITDGQSQDMELTAEQAALAQNDGIVMYAVGVGEYGEQLNEQELTNIAGDPHRVFVAASYRELNLLKEQLTHRTCEGVLQSLEQKASQYRD